MGMPKIECTHIDECCALTSLLQSVALEEAALAHVINAEGEKLQKAVCMAKCIDELIAINESVASTIGSIAEVEAALRDKTLTVIEEIQNLRGQYDNDCMC